MLKFTLQYLIFAPTCFGPPAACESHATRHSAYTPQTETHAATTLQNLQRCIFTD